jgi:hypothetical protein
MSTEFTDYNYTDIRNKDTVENTVKEMWKINIIVAVWVSLLFLILGLILGWFSLGEMKIVRDKITQSEQWFENVCWSGMIENIKIITDNSKILKDKFKTPYESKYLWAKCNISKK